MQRKGAIRRSNITAVFEFLASTGDETINLLTLPHGADYKNINVITRTGNNNINSGNSSSSSSHVTGNTRSVSTSMRASPLRRKPSDIVYHDVESLARDSNWSRCWWWKKRFQSFLVVLIWIMLFFLIVTSLVKRIPKWHKLGYWIQKEREGMKWGHVQTTSELTKEFQVLKDQLNASLQEETLKYQKQIRHLISHYKNSMHQSIKLFSKRELLAKYGPGPHYVEILLDFNPDVLQQDKVSTGRIVIEMAPFNLMPHSVYWFLEQVSSRLYEGCSFYLNAGHVLQAGPTSADLLLPSLQKGNEVVSRYQQFDEAGLAHVLFQEYSPHFPHYRYTLGYAGRPGGPNFYISLKDNSQIHGPGGQTNIPDPSEADPCFAKIVEGFDVVHKMQQSEIDTYFGTQMNQNVTIRRTRILENRSQPTKQQEHVTDKP